MEKTTAREIMSNEVLSVREDVNVEEVLKILVNNKITGLPVVDKSGKMVGIVSEYDLLVQLAESSRKQSTKGYGAEAFSQPFRYTKKADSIPETKPLSDIIDLFIESKYRRLPVVDKTGRLIGIITRRDLMRLFYYRARLT